ncbi:MAG TPA: ornithine cyclodeaminase family protein, partial [Anaerolineae bacterium]
MSDLKILYLSRKDVEAANVSMVEIIKALEVAFREKGHGRVEMPPKPGIHTRPDAFIHAMPAYIPAQHAAGIKWVGGYPENVKKNLPYITGVLVLNDDETGLPLAIMDCSWITAKRTGAASALSAKYLARPESETLGVIGCGVQGRSHLEALKVLFPIKRVVGYDPRPEAAEAYAREAREKYGIEAVAAKDPRGAVEDMDLIVTAGPIFLKPHNAVKAGWLKPGAFASMVDYDSSWDRAALAEIDKFTTDDIAQLEYYRTEGYFQNIPPIYAELGELAAGFKPGRQSATERTVGCNLGLAIDDMATAAII